MAASKYRTTPEATTGMPKGIPYIISNEAAERFSYYGMRAILTVFMIDYLFRMTNPFGSPMNKAEATEYSHWFMSAVYFCPLLGALLSDVFFGKYRTIFWLSFAYCAGHGALALMGGFGLTPAAWLAIGLGLIAVGSGGIKPCVSAHVGDQFGKENRNLLSKVFQWFYFSVNVGSTVSTIAVPVLLKWYGPHVAFGVPGVLMAIATLCFWLGRKVFVHVPPGGTRFLKESFSREGLVALAKLGIIYTFVAIFWSLFDQSVSSWVLQAKDMDRNWLGMVWLESQVQAMNPILVLLLIPVFQFLIYPAIHKVFPLTPLRKIGIGLFLTAGSFVVIAMAQELIDSGSTPSIAWQFWAYVLLTGGEIMISITGLEFSYTQAPKTMKSAVMALWLISVSLGNVFTGLLNHGIQVEGIAGIQEVSTKLREGDSTVGSRLVSATALPEPSAGQTKSDVQRTVTLAGPDKVFGTADDVTLVYNGFGEEKSVMTSENAVLESAAERIDKAFAASSEDTDLKALPDDGAGNELISDLKDSLGQPLRYEQDTRNDYRIMSAGHDRSYQAEWQPTPWDIVMKGSVSRVRPEESDDAALTWLERRIIEVKGEEGRNEVDEGRKKVAETSISHSFTVGGQLKLEGAAYFWFWCGVMLIAAFVYLPVAWLYKERSYVDDDDDAAVIAQEALAEGSVFDG